MSGHSNSASTACGERRFSAIFEASPDCIKLVGADCRLTDINVAGLRMIEADCASQVRGRSLFDIIDPAYHQTFRDGVEAVFAGKTTQIQFEIVGLRGRRLFMDQTAAPLFAPDDHGRVVEMVAVTRNVSAQRRAEADLLQARLSQEVTRSAAHYAASLGRNLKIPLDTIIGYSEMLLEAAQEQRRECEAEDAQRVLDAAAYLSSLLNEMLQTALAETRKSTPAYDVDDFLEAAAAAVRPIAEAHGNRINIEIDPRCASLPANEDMLAQCLQALLSHAAKHTRNGVVTVKARPMSANGPPRLAFSVIDTGAGLSPEQLNALFEAPSILDGAVGGAPAATLTGLAAAHRLAVLMGGDIKATSAPGRGSRFTLDIPVR
jgi:PAS domain S-box-containing protein